MTIELTGLDGSNPMGFLAALGVLDAGEPSWALGWRDDGTWSAFLEGPDDREQLVNALVEDRLRWSEQSLLTDTPAVDIKMSSESFRVLARHLIEQKRTTWPTSAAWLGVLGNELARDGSGNNIKPSALHFTAGQQKFLSAVREIRDWTATDKPAKRQFRNMLFQPWRRDDAVKSLMWDATVTRDYALRQDDPSGDAKLTEAGGEWLAFRGLLALPSAPSAGRLQTACVGGGWKTGWFRWPLWASPASATEVAATLRQSKMAALTPAQRQVRGFFACFTSAIRRSDQGGYGSFAPARPARASDDPT